MVPESPFGFEFGGACGIPTTVQQCGSGKKGSAYSFLKEMSNKATVTSRRRKSGLLPYAGIHLL